MKQSWNYRLIAYARYCTVQSKDCDGKKNSDEGHRFVSHKQVCSTYFTYSGIQLQNGISNLYMSLSSTLSHLYVCQNCSISLCM